MFLNSFKPHCASPQLRLATKLGEARAWAWSSMLDLASCVSFSAGPSRSAGPGAERLSVQVAPRRGRLWRPVCLAEQHPRTHGRGRNTRVPGGCATDAARAQRLAPRGSGHWGHSCLSSPRGSQPSRGTCQWARVAARLSSVPTVAGPCWSPRSSRY